MTTMPIGVLPVSGGGGGGPTPPLIIPLGGVMGDSSGTWTTGGSVSIDWSLYAGLYTTWEFTAVTVCSGGAFATGVQLLDQTNANILATITNNSTTPVANVAAPPLGPIPGAGTILYLAQVKIVGASPQPSDRAVLLSSYLTLLP